MVQTTIRLCVVAPVSAVVSHINGQVAHEDRNGVPRAVTRERRGERGSLGERRLTITCSSECRRELYAPL
ncbi:hypothetical protein HanXRQr2_Chr06g0264871 [Helianthus annuus]|uniref:Uncharacterized protein n=1 Tax=Helianthus annuus TaxID=4232 RepID=A0A9K3IUD8_HELAN|nr:hypothetical protein HanXRQr2_Chr06g0264871 [Helianthus annuus]